jgi:hypothetical protein
MRGYVSHNPYPASAGRARALLRDCDGFGGIEAWIAEQPWLTAPGGWAVSIEL